MTPERLEVSRVRATMSMVPASVSTGLVVTAARRQPGTTSTAWSPWGESGVIVWGSGAPTGRGNVTRCAGSSTVCAASARAKTST